MYGVSVEELDEDPDLLATIVESSAASSASMATPFWRSVLEQVQHHTEFDPIGRVHLIERVGMITYDLISCSTSESCISCDLQPILLVLSVRVHSLFFPMISRHAIYVGLVRASVWSFFHWSIYNRYCEDVQRCEDLALSKWIMYAEHCAIQRHLIICRNGQLTCSMPEGGLLVHMINDLY